MSASSSYERTASLRPLASRDFRLLFAGTIAVWFAMPLQFITQIFWIQDTFPDREVLYVGLVSASRGLAMLTFGLIGGAFADRYERRRVLLAGQLFALAVNVAIAALMLLHPFGEATFFVLLALTFAAAAVVAVDMPTRNASLPAIVPPADLAGAVSLNMMAMQIAVPLTLPLAGLLNEVYPSSSVFAGTVVIWFVVIPLIASLRFRSTGGASAVGGVLANIAAGLRYTRADRVIFGVVALVVAVQVVGMPGVGTLGPVWMTSILGLSESQFGLIAMVWGIGAAMGSLFFTRFTGLATRGTTICAAAILFALAAVFFGHSRWIPATALANFALGFALSSVMLSGTAIAQSVVSDEMRGRVMGLFPLAMGLAMLNAAPVSAVAELVSLQVVVPLLGWATLVATASIITTQPALRRYRDSPGRARPADRPFEPLPASSASID